MSQPGSSPLTPNVAGFLLGLLKRQQIDVGAPDFEEAVSNVLTAKQQLQAIVDATERPLQTTEPLLPGPGERGEGNVIIDDPSTV